MTATSWISDRLREARAAMPKRVERPDPPGVTIPAYIPAQLKALSWLATIGVFYMLWLFSVGAARDAAAALHITHAGTWTGDLLFWFPVVAAYLIIAWVVAWTGKVAVPAFVSLRWTGDEKWPKAWMLVIMIAVSAVIIGGSIVVQTETRFEGNREAAVAVEQVQRGRAAIEAERDAAREELNQALSNTNAYLNQAANVGAAEWERSYVAQARATNDPRLPQIERALGAARRADELRAEIRRLTTEIAQAPTDASVTQRVATSEADQAMGGFVDWIGAVRAIMLAILQDIACLLLPWIAMRTEQARNRQMATSADIEPADKAHMIPDLRAETEVVPEPMEPIQEAVFVDGKKSEAAKKGWDTRKRVAAMSELRDLRKQRERLTRQIGKATPGKTLDDLRAKDAALLARIEELREVAGEVGDEKGALYDNDTRVATAAAGVVMAPSMAADAIPVGVDVQRDPENEFEAQNGADDAGANSPEPEDRFHTPEPTALSPDILAAIADLNAEPPLADDAHTLADNAGILVDEDEQYGPPAPAKVMEDA